MNLPPLLSKDEVVKRSKEIPNWKLIDKHHFRGVFKFKDFKDALDFTVKVGEVAESLTHHPEINLSWGRVEIIIFTHDRGGVTELDFRFVNGVNELLN
ncbi:MAG: 4a-hydroxytetrahydrobiopterin dehydratase [Methanobacterium sp.]|nr:4a-hydroxytetrahydrobiopterin dehydratase [Methanobacterium sp.]